jgi:hypothetical protein
MFTMAKQPPSPPVSQTTAFLIFVVTMVLAGPFIYALVTKTVFIASPGWIGRVLWPTGIAAGVMAILSIPLLWRANPRPPKSVFFMVPVAVIGMIMAFVLWSLPFVMSKFASEPTAFVLTVSNTERQGKVRCDFPFSLAEIQQTFCAATAEEHQRLQLGTKVEFYGQGNGWGLTVEGYRLAE